MITQKRQAVYRKQNGSKKLTPEQQRRVNHKRVTTQTIPQGYNLTETVTRKGGWPALFGGESQAKTVHRAIKAINNQGRGVAAITPDSWGFFKRIGHAFVAVVTLGFVVKKPNLLIVTEPIR